MPRGSRKLEGGISLRMRCFAEVYDGNGREAAIKAGYPASNAASRASKLLADERVQAIIRSRELARTSGDIAKREERQRYWTAIMRDETRTLKERTRASELLGKSEGDFFERSEVSHQFPSVLPEKLDSETLVFIARGGLRTAVGAVSPVPEGEGDDGDEDDGAPAAG